MPSKIFYQSSMPRAGSTLLQNILAQNPEIYTTPTSGLLDVIYGVRNSYTSLIEFKAQDAAQTGKAFLAFSRAGMEAHFGALTDKPYVVDKNRGWGVHFDLLTAIFGEEPKIICMVRDLRQIAASLEKKFRQNPERHRALENHSNQTGNTTLKRAIMHLQSKPVGLSLDRLIEMEQRGWSKKILVIRFEDLTLQPKQAMQEVYAYLGLPYFEHDFAHVPQATHEDDEVFGIPGLHDIKPKVEPLQKDYVSVLGKEAVQWVEKNYAWYFSTFGYNLGSF